MALTKYSPEKCDQMVSDLDAIIGQFTRLKKLMASAPAETPDSAKEFNLKQVEDAIKRGGWIEGLIGTAYEKLEKGIVKGHGIAAAKKTLEHDAKVRSKSPKSGK